jgi:hypothetical protein
VREVALVQLDGVLLDPFDQLLSASLELKLQLFSGLGKLDNVGNVLGGGISLKIILSLVKRFEAHFLKRIRQKILCPNS